MFFPEENGNESDPMPILPSLGGAITYPLFGPMALEFSMDFYGTDYGYSYRLNRAVPAEPANRTAFVIGSVLALSVLATFELPYKLSFRAYGGPAADLRLSLLSYGLDRGDIDENNGRPLTDIVHDISAYFWGQGRWFLPVLGLGLDYQLLPRIRLGLDARIWFPLYKLWTGEDLPPLEGWRFGIGLRAAIT
jgi:hypothetical protein